MFSLQCSQNRRITYDDMASDLGVSSRAFSEWMRGARKPAAMEALLTMLSMLSPDEALRVIDMWDPQMAHIEASTSRASDKITLSPRSSKKQSKSRRKS